MDRDDALDDEMRRHPRDPVLPLDPIMVERILDGAVPAEDVPPDYRDVLRVLAAAAAPAPPTPFAEAAALAAFRSTRHPVDPPRRTSVLSKLLGAKALAAVVIGTASVGTAAAAATGALPDQAQATAHRIVGAVPDSDRAAEGGTGAASAAHSTADSVAKTAGAGGHQALPGAVGLCQAYASGQGGENGARLDSAGLRRLSDAAGGADHVAAYCGTVAARARTDAAAGQPDTLAGPCRSWLAADRAGRTATPDAVLDRLATAAGGPDSIASFCSELVGSAAQKPVAEKTPAAPANPTMPAPPVKSPGGNAPTDRSIPSHPAPPTPRG